MSGFPGDLSDTQTDKLAKFRASLQDVLQSKHDDAHLLKFLRARRFDVKKSEKMIRNDIEWRKENKIDTFLQWYKVPEVFTKYWCGGYAGVDKVGHGIVIMALGNFDPKGTLFSAKVSDIVKTYTYNIERHMEKHDELVKQLGVKKAEGFIIIFDMASLGVHHLWKPGVDALIRCVSVAEQHYPEFVYKIFIINAPRIFPVGYSLVKPFLREDTRKKVEVLGGNWKEVFLKNIDPEHLPAQYGGSMTDPDGDERCPSKIMQGGKIPKEYYLKDREPPHTMNTHNVSRGGVLEFKYEVGHQDSVLRYEFQTNSADIKFGVDRLVDGKKRTAVMKLEKFNSHMVPENGEIILQEPGTYLARFDNSHSWTKTKKLSYWLEVLEPTDEEPDFEETLANIDNLNLDD